MTVRVVAGEIYAKDATVRAVIPTSHQPRWPPIERVAETIATPRRRFPAHSHEGVEVLTYVLEGSGLYSYDTGPLEPVGARSIHLLTAGTNVAHSINPGKGQTLRWLSVVATLPGTASSANRSQASIASEGRLAADGTRTRGLVGPDTAVQSAVGLQAFDIDFADEGTTFHRVGHTVNAVAYAVNGTGSIDGVPIELGEAGLIEGSAGVAIQGRPGFRLILVQVPRPA